MFYAVQGVSKTIQNRLLFKNYFITTSLWPGQPTTSKSDHHMYISFIFSYRHLQYVQQRRREYGRTDIPASLLPPDLLLGFRRLDQAGRIQGNYNGGLRSSDLVFDPFLGLYVAGDYQGNINAFLWLISELKFISFCSFQALLPCCVIRHAYN